MEIFLRSVWGCRLQQLLCCKICFTHFKQNARTAVPKQIRWRGDQNPSFLFLIPYRVAAGSWNDCCCMLKADSHRAENYFHAPCEVRRLEDSLKKKSNFHLSYMRKLRPRCNVTTHPNEIVCFKEKASFWAHYSDTYSHGSVFRGSTVNTVLSGSCLVSWVHATSSGEPLIFLPLFCVVLGGRSCLPPCCYPCCCNYSVVWGIFGLTCCIPFASPRDWNKSKHYGLPSGKLIALDVYVLVFTELDCTVWSLPGCIWLSIVCVFFFMCSVRSCVQSCRKHRTQNIKIILTVAEELNVCL